MKYLLIFLLFVIISWQPAGFQPKKILPVYVSFSDSSVTNKDIKMGIIAAFGKRKIKTINKAESEALSKSETARVLTPFYENAKAMGAQPSFEDMKDYMAERLDIVANHLIIKIQTDSQGYIKDTIQWKNGRIPFNFRYPPANKWSNIVLNTNSYSSILEMCQSVADSVIASGKLYAE
jgi:sensor histidine kinase regulating citrate/malate metabolism